MSITPFLLRRLQGKRNQTPFFLAYIRFTVKNPTQTLNWDGFGCLQLQRQNLTEGVSSKKLNYTNSGVIEQKSVSAWSLFQPPHHLPSLKSGHSLVTSGRFQLRNKPPVPTKTVLRGPGLSFQTLRHRATICLVTTRTRWHLHPE